jgi:hypothetical protein
LGVGPAATAAEASSSGGEEVDGEGHIYSLLHETLFNFIICLLQVYLKYTPSIFFGMVSCNTLPPPFSSLFYSAIYDPHLADPVYGYLIELQGI